ncbi:MAG: chromosome segregation protein SMC [Candidatus Hydrogenedentes bacterium]|nr:chromosome segregation protein SMC [Candidatus Hydrogenedentota bacterium]
MYLRQVELIGFKTFADRTVISFNPGTTAIVGPNGCGKSNVLDAIRWVLGEQSSRELRTFQMADVIFNGNDLRPPLGMAEVTLTLDNHDGKLPIDFSEVQITRKVYRSGEGEYFINKSPCRLKDIIDLFMDTGIGTDSYSIIGQGKIDLIISTHPEDRRQLFEEVAGVQKYKSRRKIALKKIELAEQNLLRLHDVIAEIERQLRSLKRQAQLAQRYRSLQNKLRELEIRNAWFNYNLIQGKIEDQRNLLNEKKTAYEETSKVLAQLESQMEEIHLKRLNLEKEVIAYRERVHKTESEMGHLENELNLSLKEVELLQLNLKSNEEAQAEKLNKLSSIESEIFRLNESKNNFSKTIEQTQKEIFDLQIEEDSISQKIGQLQKEIQERQQFLIDQINSKNRLRAKMEVLQNQKDNLEKQICESQKVVTLLTEKLKGIEREKDEIEAHTLEIESECNTISLKIAEKENELESLTREISEKEKILQKVREDYGRVEARLNSLKELRDRYEGYTSGVRAVMNAKNEGLLGGEQILGPIGDLIRVTSGYELAIESALGANINNIVVRTAEHAKLAIAFLKENWAGRVTFLPLDTLKPSAVEQVNKLNDLPGVIGPAINYVETWEEVNPALRYLLFNTYIVNTIDDAINIAKTYQKHPKFVTLDGEVITPAGTVTGGRTKHESRGLLSRISEIENLETQLSKTSETIELLIYEIQKLSSLRKEVDSQIQALKKELHLKNDSLQELKIELTKILTNQEQIIQQIESLKSNIESLYSELTRIDLEQDSIGKNYTSEVVDEDVIKEEISKLEKESAKLRSDLDTNRKKITDLRILLTEHISLTQDIERQITKLFSEKEEIQNLLTHNKSKSEDTIYRIQTLQEKISESRQKLAELNKARESVHAEMLKTQENYQELVATYEELTMKIKNLRSQSQQMQEEVHNLDLQLSQLLQQSEFLRARIIDEYKVDLQSLAESDVGGDEFDENERAQQIEQIKQQIQKLGTVNPMAIEEYEETQKRHQFFTDQQKDLLQARDKLKEVIDKIDATVLNLFTKTFREVGENFKEYFRRLFGGGHARVYLIDENDPLESGIEIEARPPGKKPQTIHQLSGGEQALTAIALLFAIFKTKPSPFCILDEVDAPLDDNNITRFLEILEEFAKDSQFILITHNKQTMARADAIIGITQQERGVSEVISVKLKESSQVPA